MVRSNIPRKEQLQDTDFVPLTDQTEILFWSPSQKMGFISLTPWTTTGTSDYSGRDNTLFWGAKGRHKVTPQWKPQAHWACVEHGNGAILLAREKTGL